MRLPWANPGIPDFGLQIKIQARDSLLSHVCLNRLTVPRPPCRAGAARPGLTPGIILMRRDLPTESPFMQLRGIAYAHMLEGKKGGKV